MLTLSKFVPMVGLLAVTGAAASAETISIQIENTNQSDGFFFTPFWVAAHNGGFDSYDGGALASGFPGITEIAETGNTAPISAAFSASAAGAAGGAQATVASVAFDGDAPVFSPGESTTFDLDVGDSTTNRYFSYASMVIPSNDLFVANGNPFSHEIFDAAGKFNGPLVISIYGRDVNDNGSEVNDAFAGAAFSANGGDSIDESVFIRNFFESDDDAAYLSSFIGSNTANGATIGSAFGEDDLIARITITQVPAPSGLAGLALGGLVAGKRRRK
ncbi:MAG: spondin domain-containing protein [Phycisphaerales bacterium]|nr:spondin domain-containing protein [Phycisphaerales bacterium]